MRRMRAASLTLTTTAVFLLAAILVTGLQARWMGFAGAPAALAAYAMPDGTLPRICGGGTGDPRHAGHVHCPACLVAAPALPVGLASVSPSAASAIARVGAPAALAAPAGPAWPPQRARAPPAATFA